MLIKQRKLCCLLDVFRTIDRNKMFPTFVFLFLFTHTGAQQSQLDGPDNTLSIIGSNVTLKCSSPSRNCSGTDWQKYVVNASPVTVFKGPSTFLNTNVTDRNRYSVDSSNGCDLVIRNVQLKDAGRFVCSAIMNSGQVTKSAYLIILDTQPKCTLNVSLNDTAEGDGVQSKCEITYKGTDIALIGWKGVGDASAAVKNGNTTINRTYSVVASAPEVVSFTCEASFVFETHDNGVPILGLATNSIPNATCSTSAIKVLYSVRGVTLSPSYSNYSPGTEISCAAKGHPPPSFKWQEKEDNDVWKDIQNQIYSQFTMSNVSSKQYRCVAMNVVRTKSYNANSSEFQVNNTDTTTAPMTSGHSFPLTVPVAIGGGVGIGVILLLVIVIIIVCCCVRSCPCYKCSHSGDKEKIKSKEEQPLTECPDIYCNISDAQRDAPKAQPRSAPASDPPKLPQNAPPKAKPRTDNAKAGKPNDYQPIHEEVTYAELATETAPRQVAPKYKDVPQETLYADVGTA